MTTGVEGMVIDAALPSYDVAISEHVVVQADPSATYRAARGLDLLRVHSPLLDAAMWVRELPSRLAGRPAPPLSRLVVGEGVGLPGWLVLGERDGTEIAFGAVGRFWQPVIEWRSVDAAEFAGFTEPGWGKIAANFSVRPYGSAKTLLSYECRTATTDPRSRRRFGRYWWLVRPFVAHIMRATVRQIKMDAEVPA
ncbi:hypothetical protein ORI20_13540 [Mycobacterium sp. CVI_P3]|uniref:DUF1990 domain-containing protein n=1 Tax=Mycobacterium pinniadriaticum TaxID=2994102 RepID=A0ABT3SDZ4_9MYCO|nr:hypothetical protein [Mycobacterium pinniadriaticum]MCX2931303.1 hypothetical protein [Mycobacterium pinniadriaticum]MCX2937727.1 hypothetical protein [Mycobacterium pinniadriaticum]